MVLLGSLIITAIVFTISIFLSPEYKSQVDILIVPQISSPGDDVSENAHYLSQVLASSLNSTSFIGTIEKYSAEINNNPQKALKDWQSQVKVGKNKDVAIVTIEVFDTSRIGAFKLSEEISSKLVSFASKYIGQTDKIKLEIISGPTSFARPAKPNIALNTGLGFLAGLVVAFVFVHAIDVEIRIKDSNAKTAPKTSFGNRLREELGRFGPVHEIYPIGKMMRQTKEALSEHSSAAENKTVQSQKQEEPFVVESVKKIEPNGFFVKSKPEKKLEPFIEDEKNIQKPLEKKQTESSASLDRLPFVLSEEELPWNIKKSGTEDEREKEDKEPEKKQKADDFVPLEELEKSADEQKKEPKEPTEEEIKNRLNKLLRGEI